MNTLKKELKRIYNLYDKKKLSGGIDENEKEGFWDFAFELLNDGVDTLHPYIKENDERTEITLNRDELWELIYKVMTNGYELYKKQ